jgi:hypothetical protein
MDAYSNATGWNRISGSAWDKAWGPAGGPRDAKAIFPDSKQGNRSTGNIISPKDNNPRAKIEMKASKDSNSERSRLGHTLGKGHVAKRTSNGN